MHLLMFLCFHVETVLIAIVLAYSHVTCVTLKAPVTLGS